jgi:hypothetical protein
MRYGPFILLASLLAGVSGQQTTDPIRHTFLQRVDDYVALHRRVEGPLPRDVVTADLEALSPEEGLGRGDPHCAGRMHARATSFRRRWLAIFEYSLLTLSERGASRTCSPSWKTRTSCTFRRA